MVTKWLFLNRKLAVAQLCKKYSPESCTKRFFSRHMSQTFGTIMTSLAMATKFWDATSKSDIINKTANIIYKKL